MVTERSGAAENATWATAFAYVANASHLAPGEQLSAVVDAAVRELGLTAELLMVDLAQRRLTPVHPDPGAPLGVDTTPAGRCYQLGEIITDSGEHGEPLLWVPVLDGADRVGVLRVGLDRAPPSGRDGPVADTAALRKWLWALAGIVGHVLVAKLVLSDRLCRLRTDRGLSPAAELLWQLLPPRTFATDRVVVSALLEPHDDVAGDAFDYNIERDRVDLAVFDAVGHDLSAGLTTALAITAIRNARRAGETDLRRIAARADDLIAARPRPPQFVTAVLAWLDATTGVLEYLIAGHPAPLLLRGPTVIKELDAPPRVPLGITGPDLPPAVVAHQQLQPGDRLLFHSDGIAEARDHHGEFFGEQRLIELTEQAAAADLSAPETLRRLTAAVLGHQDGLLQDDATLMLVEWSTTGHTRMFPGGVTTPTINQGTR
ncbi:MAG: Serine phosphatase RsbU, regulator of sigma subunit [uncultured Pseudonocardia sp.]|uniref:Serine phosphatase RsbU, regulator of sigma subunit n=1 Tax=uncultured Pseudonocardia sp. TaxID=211455 RepID=A0A6J4QBN1_9PSEU|nr:MAG: Serine phosphatase RsbU, regulator of sigma subunit [uncultured Pseudonocardia sp.]